METHIMVGTFPYTNSRHICIIAHASPGYARPRTKWHLRAVLHAASVYIGSSSRCNTCKLPFLSQHNRVPMRFMFVLDSGFPVLIHGSRPRTRLASTA